LHSRLRSAARGGRAPPPSARRAAQVGHNALGAGQVVDQGARLCDRALESHRLWDLDGWQYLAPAVHAGGTLHFIGLLSDGGVHSRYDQLLLLLTGVRAPRSGSLPAPGLAGPLPWARALRRPCSVT
jgi:2,4-dienoyl-CoA reductase-like NADH-dependent reductase (Old Yellow Enzyme family)